jgi:hypothetical protein
MRAPFALVLGLVAGAHAVHSAAQDAPRTWTVSPGQSIQDAIDKASPGDTVQVLPGEYVQSVEIAKDDIVLLGLEYEGVRATLNGKANEEDKPLEFAIRIRAKNVTVAGFVVRGFGTYGVAAFNCEGVTLRDLVVQEVGTTAVGLDHVRQAVVERVVAGHAGMFALAVVGSMECRVQQSEGFMSGTGLYVASSQQLTVDNSSFHHNGVGIVLAGSTADTESRTAYVKVLRSRMIGNNGTVPGPEGAVRGGVGLLVFGASDCEIAGGEISENGSMGVLALAYDEEGPRHRPKDAPRSGPPSERLYVHHNTYVNNGTAPSPDFEKYYAGVPAGDIYWDGLGERNQFQERADLKTFPEKLVVEQGGVHSDVIHFQ